MTVRRHPVREHPRRLPDGGVAIVARHQRGYGATWMHNRAAATAANTATRRLGSCQICEADHKLDEQDLIVHHGYLRPGDGRIHGDCIGVAYPPYEVSCDRCVDYLAGLRRREGDLRASLAHFEDPALATFTRTRAGLRRHDPTVTVTYTHGTTPAWEWNQELRGVLGELRRYLDANTREIARIERRIHEWTPQPIRTVEEMVRREQAHRAARAVAQAARAAAREVAERAQQAKRDALVAKKQAGIEAMRTTIRDLARRAAAGEDVKKAVARVDAKVHSGAFVRLCRYDVGNTLHDVRHEAVRLGIARTDARGDVVWNYY